MEVVDWGTIDYEKAVDQQLDLVGKVSARESEDTLVFCTHPPVVTVGRAGKGKDVFSWSGQLVESSRGGRATYHGPNQIVLYPIIDLSKKRKNLKSRDLNDYLRSLESIVIETLGEFGIKARTRNDKVLDANGNDLLMTGVWVGDQKIASLGVAVKRWVTYHGVAINVFEDDQAFCGINPCGFSKETMTSVEAQLGARPDLESFKGQLSLACQSQFR